MVYMSLQRDMIHREKLEIVEDYAEPVASRWSSEESHRFHTAGREILIVGKREETRCRRQTCRCLLVVVKIATRPLLAAAGRCDAMRCDTVTMDRSKLRRWVLSESRRGRGEKEVKNTIRIISYLSYGRPGATSDYEGYCLYAREYTN